MADLSAEREPQSRRPQYVMTLWRTTGGVWQGRLKSLQDGAEQIVEDLRDLPGVLMAMPDPKENHA
ncbi:hypothetical protein ACFP9V_19650 [Deinococcus radiopugnans]|uniref:Uncharacterized protein n=1 Tax=Deinococcus radiopugnans ATCC 19172 TaxID=585398 RepID=A0A5C4YAP6_9DEIO|nr:hypothetical protein [Deinococcus radiopugnans]MBB6015287.1 hypothetical protein [Deinococcus radiopugnans ATCC 19172]QLG13156.1 hypothetical protein HLB42_19775 [Deinococcus sp. D7000]TNM73015.1 hypothetical protein FHR04_00890 [Deinococcus radiopugnans ATCC 19172]